MRTTILLALTLAACGEATPPAAAPTPPPVEPAPTPPPAADPGTGAAPPSDADAEALAAGLRGLGARLFRELAVPANESAALAPMSVAGALAMTAAGGRGATASEVWSALGLAGTEDRAPQIVAGALAGLEGEELAVANRLFADDGLTIEPPFTELARSLFGAPVERVDYAAAEAAIARINAWTSEATRTRIPEILPAGSVDADTRLVLVNALYFLASWQTRFDEALTQDDTFQAPGGAVPCRMMHRRGPAMIGAAAGATVLRLPYANDRFFATFVLPDEGTTLAALEASMTGETIGAWLDAPSASETAELELPRFRVESAAPVELSAPLSRLGVRTMFTEGADFGGITTSEPLRVSHVFHRVFVETTERGTEAAAATAVVMARGARLPGETRRFRADRPFLFFVTDARGLVLFFARVATPGQPG